MSKLIENVLATDHLYRKKGIKGDLYHLSDLKPADWDYSLPTLTSQQNVFLKTKIKEMKMKEFISRFQKRFPELNGLNWDNLLIAGGCLGSFLLEQSINDVDIFLYGLTVEEADAKIEEICHLIVTNLKQSYLEKENGQKMKKYKNKLKSNPDTKKPKLLTLADVTESQLDLKYVRTQKTLTIEVANSEFQIIFRVYQTASEILHGFDLGSSSIGFNGRDLLFTTLSKFAYEYNCNIIDTTRRSTTYERRLKKYFKRGFEIVMPHLDLSKCSGRMYETYYLADVCEMPYWCFTYNGRTGNRIHFSNWYEDHTKKYQVSDYDDLDDQEEYSLYYRNLKSLMNEEYDRIVYLDRKSFQNILAQPECFAKARVDYFYDELHQKIKNTQHFPTSMVKNYISVRKVDDVFIHREDPQYVAQVIQDQKEFIYQRMARLANHDKKIKWLTDNPGTQLTSSYNPIIKDEAEWYGEYYLDPNGEN